VSACNKSFGLLMIPRSISQLFQNPFICIKPRDPPFGSLRLNADGLQFDSRAIIDSRTVRWSTGQPRFTASAENCSQAEAYGSINSVELVVVVGSIIYCWTFIVVGVTVGAAVFSGRIVIPNNAKTNDPIRIKGLFIIFSPMGKALPMMRKRFEMRFAP